MLNFFLSMKLHNLILILSSNHLNLPLLVTMEEQQQTSLWFSSDRRAEFFFLWLWEPVWDKKKKKEKHYIACLFFTLPCMFMNVNVCNWNITNVHIHFKGMRKAPIWPVRVCLCVCPLWVYESMFVCIYCRLTLLPVPLPTGGWHSQAWRTAHSMISIRAVSCRSVSSKRQQECVTQMTRCLQTHSDISDNIHQA